MSNAKGARLYSKPDAKSRLRKEVLPEGQVLESCEKWTPAGSSVRDEAFFPLGGVGGWWALRSGGAVPVSCMHGRTRMSIDPRIPCNAGTEHVGFSPSRQASQ